MMTFTTRLLEGLDDRMPRRHQVIVAVLIVFLALASIAGSRPAERPAQLVQPPIYILITTTPQPAMGLAKRAARIAPALAPTAAPRPTIAPAPEQIQIVVAVPTEAPTVEPLPPTRTGPTGNPPRWTIR